MSVSPGKERERELQLSDLERERLEDMLRQLRIERSDIQTAMLFALDHANCAAEISECLIASLTLPETPLHLKISRCVRFSRYYTGRSRPQHSCNLLSVGYCRRHFHFAITSCMRGDAKVLQILSGVQALVTTVKHVYVVQALSCVRHTA